MNEILAQLEANISVVKQEGNNQVLKSERMRTDIIVKRLQKEIRP